MITPRRTRIIRVPDLRAFRSAIARSFLELEGSDSRAGLIVVPTHAAARVLRRTIESSTERARTGLSCVTRERLYEDLARRAGEARLLTALEREALAQAAAVEAARTLPRLPFRVRPGLVSEMLAFYDQLRRQAQQVRRFEQLMEDALGSDASAEDVGALRMLQQTHFLAETFRRYEARVAASRACDEHGLRERLALAALQPRLRRIVLTVSDWIGEPDGLFVADFDMLARLPGLEVLDIVSTAATLDSGFHERLHRWLPGLEEVGWDETDARASTIRPVLRVKAGSSEPWLTLRDRGEELAEVATRAVETRRRRGLAPASAVVYKQPLPYLYLAPATLGAAGLTFESLDGLPLAAEPTATVVDVVLEFVETSFARNSAVALLRSPHLLFESEGSEVGRESAAALDRFLSGARYLGGLEKLEMLRAAAASTDAAPAFEAVITAAHALSTLTNAAPASQLLGTLRAFLEDHARPLAEGDSFRARESRARRAVFSLLEHLAMAHAEHHDELWHFDDLAAAVRRWLEQQTFNPDTGDQGIILLDDRAARYGEFEEMALVGLVENEWPERAPRNIFYPPRLLQALGWPSERDRRSADKSRFVDLVASPADEIVVSTFVLENDTIVTPSALLEELPRAGLTSVTLERDGKNSPIFADDALAREIVDARTLPSKTRRWASLRASRSRNDALTFHGQVGPFKRDRPWSVSALETYLGCPFKFFAQYVLELGEDPDDEEMMDPRRQGAFVHRVFEQFFKRWQLGGRGAISPETLDEARTLFREVANDELDELGGPEAGLERTRLLGSAAAAGLGDAVLRMEAERPAAVVERLLEYRLSGPITLTTTSGPRQVVLRGTVDRLDLLADGTFRLIDYKLGWPPNRARALQLPIYALWAEQWLSERRPHDWALAEAVYVAFKGPRRIVPLFTTPVERVDVLTAAQQRLADTLDAVGRGEFPPTPDDVFRCETCPYSAVCRKDYVGDV